MLLIDCSLLHESRNQRFCGSCRPEAAHELAGHAPRVLVRMNLPEEVLKAALAARRFVIDQSQSYALVGADTLSVGRLTVRCSVTFRTATAIWNGFGAALGARLFKTCPIYLGTNG
jgi:hypothetical protein